MSTHATEEHTPHACPCCGAWALPGQPTCGACRHHLEPCHRNRTPLQRLAARFDQLADVRARWRRRDYGGGE
jgi:hypothetical protein